MTSKHAFFMGSVSEFIDSGMSADLALFFFVMWSIWGNRNQAIFGDSTLPPAIVLGHCKTSPSGLYRC